MKAPGRSITTLTVLLLILGGGLSLWSLLPEIDATAERAAEVYHAARPTPSYVLSRTRWTTFPVPPGGGRVKLVTNANVPLEFHGVPGFFGTYAIRYELLAEDEEILRTRSYTLRSAFSHYRSRKTGSLTPIQFYRSEPLLPLVSRAVFVNLEGCPRPPIRLRVRLAWAEPVIEDVVVRMYRKDAPPPRQLRYLWKRMSREKRERISRANIYGVDLLSEAERRNLLLNRSAAVGPLGAYGRDYVERRLYTLDKEDAEAAGVGILPAGLYVDEGLLGVIPLPRNGGCIRLEVERLCMDGECDSDGILHVTWFERGAGERTDTVVRIPQKRTFFMEDFEEGLLELHSQAPLVVKAFLLEVDGEEEITPVPECVPGYMLREERPLEFLRGGERRLGTPLRIDVRRLRGEGDEAPGPTRVRYTFLDESGRVVGSGALDHLKPVSPYDSALGAFSGYRVTGPSRAYLRVPAGCASVNFYSAAPDTLLTVYTRPPGLARKVDVPEDYVGFEPGDEEGSNWFLVRPRNYLECLREHLEVVLKVQRRPSRAAPWVESGDYHVELLEPGAERRSYSLVTPVEEREQAAERPSPARFVMLEPGEEKGCYLRFEAGGGRQAVTPRVLCFKPDFEPERVMVLVDGEPRLDTVVATNAGAFSMDALEPGLHKVTALAPESAVLLINSVSETDGPAWLQRTVYLVDRHGLRFRVPRAGRQRVHITLRAFLPAEYSLVTEPGASLPPFRIRVMVGDCIREPGVLEESWTFCETLYDIDHPSGVFLPLLEANGRVVSGGEPFFLTLGSDLPAGDKDIIISVAEGPPCYIQAARLAPGQDPVRRVFTEGTP